MYPSRSITMWSLIALAALWSASAAAQQVTTPAVSLSKDAPALPEVRSDEPSVATSSLAQGTARQSAPLAPSLAISNVFDSERKAWPDRIPPPPPAPPPPAPAPVTDGDLQLYGVVLAGTVKRATVKTGPRFADAGTNPRGFVALSEGQQLGEFTVAAILPTHIVLAAPGGRQSVYFTKKTDRVAAAATPVAGPAPVQAPSDHPPRDSGGPTSTSPTAAPLPPPGAPAGAAPTRNISASPSAAANSGPTQTAAAPPVNIQNSLAAAIAAAQANPANRPTTNEILNPFAPAR